MARTQPPTECAGLVRNAGVDAISKRTTRTAAIAATANRRLRSLERALGSIARCNAKPVTT